jgi:OOP family OmpA-OmpF porin
MRKNYVVMVLLFMFSMIVAAGVSYGENKKGALTITPHIGGYIFEGNQNINSGPVYGFGIGYNLTKRFGLEGVYDYVSTDSKSPNKEPDVKASILRLDALYHFMPDSDFVPYVSAGIGAIDIDKSPGDSDTSALLNAGGGVKYFITEDVAARGEVRYLRDIEDDYNNFMYTLGLVVQFGGKEKAPPMPKDSDGDGVPDDLDKCPDTPAGVAVDSDGCPLDSDGDGVPDHLDKCPNTPAGVEVDSDGCPADSDGDGVPDHLDKCPNTPSGVAVDKKGCPLDSDGDGVPDYRDKCPGTPAGAPVDASGCPLDSDGDGIPDYMDKCPDTPAGIKVDSKGCPVPFKDKVSIELKVKFAFDSDVVESVFDEHIQKVANFLKAYPETMAEIVGHTDSVGPEQYNLKLSQRRADNVMKYLIAHGVDASRLTAKGYGESMPVADNSTAEGRRKNRRVVAEISAVVTRYKTVD